MTGIRDRAGSPTSMSFATNERHETQEDWVRGLRAYLLVIAIGNLVWEILHLPLYKIWNTGTVGEKLSPSCTAQEATC